jgi:hypothetical protein
VPESNALKARLGKFAYVALLALSGAVVGFLGADHFDNLKLSWEDGLAVVIGAALIVSAIATLVLMLWRSSAIPRGLGFLQVLVLVLAGVMLAAPVAMERLFGGVPARWVFIGIVLLFALQTVANVLVWVRSDELMRRVMADTSVWTFWPLQGALFLFAAAERLGLVQPISAWGMTGILMSVYLVASSYVAIRRGLT